MTLWGHVIDTGYKGCGNILKPSANKTNTTECFLSLSKRKGMKHNTS